ncbi:MAG: cytochrome b/b6 domain-containing protein, partial [Planctomycetes bacterium]|nr:cytochrome b/b6 domain-containing protein [Planctomycetota bacterium]
AVLDRYQHPDSVASYLASFHGKAMLLGSQETANCLDCHVAELANVHLMKPHDDPKAPTSSGRLPDTCRSAACHPTAGHAISTAAIHLDLATGRGLEYFIGLMFFLLILSTFGPSVVILALELLQIVVGRHDPTHERHRSLAERLMADPRARARLKRFTPHQRVQHWVLFGSFALLVLTGFPIKFADRAWAAWIIDQIGNLHRARLIHRWAGVTLIAGFLYHMVYVAVHTFREGRRAGKGLMRTLLDLPMVMQWDDLKQMRELFKFLLFIRKTRPPAGRFSLEEKFEYFGVFWGSMLLGVTGVLMWANAWTSEILTGRVLTVAALIHTFEAFLALLHVGIIHMISVIFSPVVFPLSPAMLTGDTPAEEMAEGHAAMLDEVARELDLAPPGEASHG